MRLEGMVSLINGAASGLGAETARLFAREGSSVVVTDIRLNAVEQVANDIVSRGGKAVPLEQDVSDADSVDEVMAFCLKHYGKLDVLVHASGIFTDAPFLTMEEETWDETIRVNLKGSFLAAQRAARVMAPRRFGRIILFGSLAGQRGASILHSHYGASKAGVFAFAQTAAQELAPYSITVNCIAPGIIATPLNQTMRDREEEKMVAGIYMKRFGQPGDVANACLFLAERTNGYITGSTIDVNGGMLGRL